MKDFLQANKIAILWYGLEWQSTFNYLIKHWVNPSKITILDKNTNLTLPEWVSYIMWDNYISSLDQFDVIFKTPGVSVYLDEIKAIKNKITSQVQVFFDSYKWKVIGITWTKWKSSTATLTYNVLKNAWYKVAFVWNIGNPVLDQLDDLIDGNYDFIVYELSSFMITDLDARIFAVIITNLYIAHLDWHQWKENYQQDKLRLAFLTDNLIIHFPTYYKFKQAFEDLDITALTFGEWGTFSELDRQFYHNGELLGKAEWLQLLWRHQRINMCGVIALCHWVLRMDYDKILPWLQQTQPLPHRQNIVWTYNGITFIDDAIATAPESTIQAIATMKEEWLTIGTIMLGWIDVGFDFTILIQEIIKAKIPNIIFFPDSWLTMKNLLDAEWYHYKALITTDMETAVRFAYTVSPQRSVCLLSCAWPSMSLRTSFKEKWSLFIKYVQELWK